MTDLVAKHQTSKWIIVISRVNYYDRWKRKVSKDTPKNWVKMTAFLYYKFVMMVAKGDINVESCLTTRTERASS